MGSAFCKQEQQRGLYTFWKPATEVGVVVGITASKSEGSGFEY
jgi:hypothetical protein